jgi:hypothetical protein
MTTSGIETLARRTVLAGLLVIFCGRIAATYSVFNDTFDESGHIVAGLEILQTRTYTLEAQHPPLSRLVVAALPYFFAGLRLGHYSELWGHGPWSVGSLRFYWKSLALARAGNLLWAVLLFFFVYRWSSALYGPWPGAAACLIAVCCPNLIAHAGLATIDIAAAATILIAAFFFWKWSRSRRMRDCLAASASFGLAALSKFSALVFLPPLAVAYFLAGQWNTAVPRAAREDWVEQSKGRKDGWQGLRQAAAFTLVFFFVIWAGYLFEVGALAPPGHRFLSAFRAGGERGAPNFIRNVVGGRSIPAHMFVQGIIDVASHNQEGHPSYLLGHASPRGHWLYFPIAIAVKSTIPMLLLVAMGIAAGRRKAGSPALPAVIIVAASMPAGINIGLRHVLAVYPFFAILSAGAFAGGRRAVTVAALALAAWHAGESIAAHPDYLAYFNEIARGREEKFLVDSNLDWGQDLARLGQYLRQHQVDSVYLSYFGRCSPIKMGVKAIPLGDQRPRQGWAAASVSNLVLRPELQWLRRCQPVAKAGKSIWIYHLGAE